MPADPIGDLNTSGNLLSVWVLSHDRSNLERVVRAVAIGKDKISDTGYVLFDAALLAGAGIEVKDNKGATPDTDANDWHRDLVLSGNKIIALTKAILRHGESGIVLKVRMRELVKEGIAQGELPLRLEKKLA